MGSTLRTLIVAGAGLSLGGAIAYGVSARAAKGPGRMWEYHCVLPPGAVATTGAQDQPRTAHELSHHSGTNEHPSERVLNHLGRQGWELVAIDPSNHHYCFKRPLGQ